MPVPIAIAVVEHEDQFLVGQRPADVALAGYWEFPGGKIEADEGAEQAAVRECLEESGLIVKALFQYPRHSHVYDHAAVDLHFVACRPLNPEMAPRPPFRWVPREELGEYRFPEANREILALLQGVKIARQGVNPSRDQRPDSLPSA